MTDGSDGSGWRNPSFVSGRGAAAARRGLSLGAGLRRRMRDGLAVGTFVIELPHPATLTALAVAGFDFAVLDMEHSSIGFTSLGGLISAAHAAELAVLVRVWGEDAGLIGKVLDMGANGVMVPHVETPERARAVVQQSRYAPLGGRGFSPLSRFDALEHPFTELNEATFVVVQVEGIQGIAQASAIASVEGLDAVFVGPYDLALSLGVPPGDASVRQAAVGLASGFRAGVGLGIYVDDPADCGAWASSGFGLQCVSFDGRMLADGVRAVAVRAQESAAEAALPVKEEDGA